MHLHTDACPVVVCVALPTGPMADEASRHVYASRMRTACLSMLFALIDV